MARFVYIYDNIIIYNIRYIHIFTYVYVYNIHVHTYIYI